MLIRKLFKFENAHIVRGCSSRRCSHSVHGHSYKVEVLLEADSLDNGQMIYDFGLMKQSIGVLIDSFDHAMTFWTDDDPAYIKSIKTFSERWVAIPVSPSAEQFSRLFFCLIDSVLYQTKMNNGESGVTLSSIIVHETDTGYAQCFREDAYSRKMGLIDIEEVVYSDAVRADWKAVEQFQSLGYHPHYSEALSRQK